MVPAKRTGIKKVLFVLLIALLCAFTVRASSDGFEDDDELPMPSRYEDEYGLDDADPYGGDMGGSRKAPRDIKELASVEEILAFIAEDDSEPAVIGYFDATTNAKDKEIFDEIGNELSGKYRFGFTTAKQALEDSKFDGCAVVAYRPTKYISEKAGEKPKARYASKTLNPKSLKKFIVEKTLPLVGELNSDSKDRYDELSIPLVTVFTTIDTEKNPKGFAYITNRVRKVASSYAGKIAFAVADKSDRSQEFSSFGFEDVGPKDIAVGLEDSALYYKLKKPFSVDNLKQFVVDFSAGKLVGVPREDHSEAPPSHDTEQSESFSNSVVTLTNENFKTEVTDSTADVMLEFYAPWCGHCKMLKPVYSKVADHFKDDAGVKIAAMDATAHDVPKNFDVQGYPTLYFLPAGSKKPVSYDGAREEKAMIEFIKKNRST